GEQVTLVIRELLGPVAAVFPKGHFLGHPVDLLLALPELISPGIFEGLVGLSGFEQRHLVSPWISARVPRTLNIGNHESDSKARAKICGGINRLAERPGAARDLGALVGRTGRPAAQGAAGA